MAHQQERERLFVADNTCRKSDPLTRREFGAAAGTAVAALSLSENGFSGPSQAAEVLASGGFGSPPNAKLLADGSDPFAPARIEQLQERGKSKVYRGEHLTAIRFLVGGIGAGALQLDGTARIAAWQIFNNFDERQVENTFFAVFAKAKDQVPVVRALQTEAVRPLQAMQSLEFQGEYPLGQYRFQDATLPIRVEMEVFNPLIPLSAKDSAIPCAIFKLTAENPGATPADVSFLCSVSNEVRSGETAGGDLANTVLKGDPGTVHLTGGLPTTPAPGDMAVTIVAPESNCVAHWRDLALLFREFATDGQLKGPQVARSTEPLHGAVTAPFWLEPGGKRTITVILAWYFPVARLGGPRDWQSTGANMYTQWWPSALAVARDVRQRLDELERQTRLYHDTLYATNLPYWMLDRLASQAAVLKSRTCFWLSHGYFGAWEGCAPDKGCCGGNCGHVWHYARSMSNWSLLLALQGFIYDGPAGRIGFLPLWNPGNHASFFTAAEGWGLFRQRREAKVQTSTIAVHFGRLAVRELNGVARLLEAVWHCLPARRHGFLGNLGVLRRAGKQWHTALISWNHETLFSRADSTPCRRRETDGHRRLQGDRSAVARDRR